MPARRGVARGGAGRLGEEWRGEARGGSARSGAGRRPAGCRVTFFRALRPAVGDGGFLAGVERRRGARGVENADEGWRFQRGWRFFCACRGERRRGWSGCGCGGRAPVLFPGAGGCVGVSERGAGRRFPGRRGRGRRGRKRVLFPSRLGGGCGWRGCGVLRTRMKGGGSGEGAAFFVPVGEGGRRRRGCRCGEEWRGEAAGGMQGGGFSGVAAGGGAALFRAGRTWREGCGVSV